MRKPLMAALAALMLAGAAAPVMAQPYHGRDRHHDDRYDRDRHHDRDGRDRDHWRDRDHHPDWDRWERWSPPLEWGYRGRWRAHVRACFRAYGSYDPRSDTYIGRHGVRHRCRL